VRLLMVESGMLAVAGTTIGVLIGQALSHVLLGSLGIASDIPITIGEHFDWRVFGYSLGIAVGAGIVVGIAPAVRASRARITDFLHDGDRAGSAGASRTRLRSALIVLQIAGSVVLLVVAGFFVRSLQRADRTDVGFDPRHVYTMGLATEQAGYDRARAGRFFDALETRVRALPGVDKAALSFAVPMGYRFQACPIEAEGAEAADDRHRDVAQYNSVGVDYFDTMRLPILRGRAIDTRDTASSTPVAVVNATMAARLWPGRDPIGKRLRFLCDGDRTLWQVVGVAGDSKYVVVFEPPLPYAYVPIAQTQPTYRAILVRSALPATELVSRLRHEIDALDPDVPIFNSRTMEDAISGGPGSVMLRTAATQGTLLGLLGVALAVVGLYGVIWYSASQRVREFGIRIALGAVPADVRALVLRQGIRLVLIGLVIGLALSAGMTFILTRFVIVGDFDAIPMIWVAAALTAVALAACYLPARRATRVDPVAALRAE
jgi:predicted permease